jgi:predicted DCC family thiol-disulfide oxidoreductase YuxK
VADAVLRLNPGDRFRVLPWQTPGLLARVGLSAQQCMDAAWFVDRTGRAYRGAAAMNAALDALGGIYRVVSYGYRVPGLKQLQDAIYAWIARNRYRMPGASDACRVPATSFTAQAEPTTGADSRHGAGGG